VKALIFPRTRLGLATGAFQSLLYQGNPSDQDVRRLIEAREGVNFSPNTARSGYWRVSIPSLSGQSFRRAILPTKFFPEHGSVWLLARFNPFFIRAILPTVVPSERLGGLQ
jgi:hypothetical protein